MPAWIRMSETVLLRYHPTMTTDERSNACSRLQSSLQSLMQETEGLSPSQWTFKPNPQSWSIGQCVEHVAEVEMSIYSRIQTLLSGGFSDPSLCAEAEGKQSILERAVPKRTRLAQAPKQPDNSPTFSTTAEGLRKLNEIRSEETAAE